MRDTRKKPWLYKLRSSESFVILVVSIAIFTVSSTPNTPVKALLTNMPTQDIFVYGMVSLFMA